MNSMCLLNRPNGKSHSAHFRAIPGIFCICTLSNTCCWMHALQIASVKVSARASHQPVAVFCSYQPVSAMWCVRSLLRSLDHRTSCECLRSRRIYKFQYALAPWTLENLSNEYVFQHLVQGKTQLVLASSCRLWQYGCWNMSGHRPDTNLTVPSDPSVTLLPINHCVQIRR